MLKQGKVQSTTVTQNQFLLSKEVGTLLKEQVLDHVASSL